MSSKLQNGGNGGKQALPSRTAGGSKNESNKGEVIVCALEARAMPKQFSLVIRTTSVAAAGLVGQARQTLVLNTVVLHGEKIVTEEILCIQNSKNTSFHFCRPPLCRGP